MKRRQFKNMTYNQEELKAYKDKLGEEYLLKMKKEMESKEIYDMDKTNYGYRVFYDNNVVEEGYTKKPLDWLIRINFDRCAYLPSDHPNHDDDEEYDAPAIWDNYWEFRWEDIEMPMSNKEKDEKIARLEKKIEQDKKDLEIMIKEYKIEEKMKKKKKKKLKIVE